MSELTTKRYEDFVDLADLMWHQGADSVPEVARNSGLFKEVPIPNNTGNSREFSEMDLEEYASRKGEDEKASRAKVQQGYKKMGHLYRVAEDIGISYEWRNYGKYLEIQNALTNLGSMPRKRLDLDLSHRLTFGTQTSYTDMDGETVDVSVGDGKALFATDHTLKGSSKTFRNRLSGNPQLSEGSLESMEKMRVENTLNQFGEKMAMPADILWTTDDPNTKRTARQILESTADLSDNKNEGVINTYQGSYRHVALPRVATDADGFVDSSKAKYWGLASSSKSTAYLGMNEEPHMKADPQDGRSNEEFSTDSWVFGTRGGWMIVVVSAGWISFSSGDGA